MFCYLFTYLPNSPHKVSNLAHFPLELHCEDYTSVDQAVEDFEHDPDSILMDSIETPELDASFDDPDAISSLVSSEFLCLGNTFMIIFKLHLVPCIKYHKIIVPV